MTQEGIYPHVDFDHRIIAFYDCVNGRKYPYDDNGHGTHVAGIIGGTHVAGIIGGTHVAGIIGGSGKGCEKKYRGIAPGCHLAAVKILDKRGNGKIQDVLEALKWVRRNKHRYGIRIINISVGTVGSETKNSRLLVKAVEEA